MIRNSRVRNTAGLLLLVLLAACAAAPEEAPSPTSLPPANKTEPAAAPEDTAAPTALPTATEAGGDEDTQPADAPPAGALELSNGTLWVSIATPEDGRVLADTSVTVGGSAAEGTVLTINDEILYLENGGGFTVTLELLPGPNTIEIIASDLDGKEVSGTLVVFYEPTQE